MPKLINNMSIKILINLIIVSSVYAINIIQNICAENDMKGIGGFIINITNFFKILV